MHTEACVSWVQNALAHNKQNLRVTEFCHLRKTNFFQNVVSGSLHKYKQTSEFVNKGTNHPPEWYKDYFKLKTSEQTAASERNLI